jgi:hypothetical protein
MPRQAPRTHKCRHCLRNFKRGQLVTEAPTHDDRGYLQPIMRWCPEHAAQRLAALAAEGDPRNAEAIASLREAIARYDAAHAAQGVREGVDDEASISPAVGALRASGPAVAITSPLSPARTLGLVPSARDAEGVKATTTTGASPSAPSPADLRIELDIAERAAAKALGAFMAARSERYRERTFDDLQHAEAQVARLRDQLALTTTASPQPPPDPSRHDQAATAVGREPSRKDPDMPPDPIERAAKCRRIAAEWRAHNDTLRDYIVSTEPAPSTDMLDTFAAARAAIQFRAEHWDAQANEWDAQANRSTVGAGR